MVIRGNQVTITGGETVELKVGIKRFTYETLPDGANILLRGSSDSLSAIQGNHDGIIEVPNCFGYPNIIQFVGAGEDVQVTLEIIEYDAHFNVNWVLDAGNELFGEGA